MLDTGHDDTDGSLVTVNELRGRVQLVILREQLADVLDTVITGGMLQIILGGLLQGQTPLFCIIDDGGHSVVAQNVLGLGRGILVENIVLNHFGFLLIVFVVFVAKGHSDHIVHDLLLFVRHRIVYVFHGLLIFGRLFFLSHFGFLLYFSGMLKDILKLTTVIVDRPGVVIDNTNIGILRIMSHNFLDMCVRIGTGQYQAEFTNDAMGHIASGAVSRITQMVCPNTERRNVTVLNNRPGLLTLLSIIERDISTYTFRAGLQKSMP